MEPIHYLRALRRRWWVIVAAVLVAGSAAWVTTTATSAAATTSKKASVDYGATIVLWDPGAPTVGPGNPITNPATLAQFVRLPNVAVLAAQKMQYEGNPLRLESRVEAALDPATGFLAITGIGKDPKSAMTVANAFSQGLIAYLGQLKTTQINQQQQQLQEQLTALLQQGAPLTVIASVRNRIAQLSIYRTTPVSLTEFQRRAATPLSLGTGSVAAASGSRFKLPKSRTLRVLLACLFGLLAGVALALVLERFDTRLRSSKQAEEAFGLPVLAEVPVISRGRRKKVVMASHPYSRAAGAFRLVGVGTSRWGANGRASENGKGTAPATAKTGAMTILVTSPEARDGKTTVAANLAVAHAQAGSRVLVVSCDLRRPAIHESFGVAIQPGVTDALQSSNGNLDLKATLDLAPYVEPCSVVRVGVVPSGVTPDHPGEILGSPKMQQFIERLKKVTDVVILDCAPLVVASDVVPLLPQADGVVLVARAGKTRQELAGNAATLLKRLGVHTAGVVLNDAREFAIPLAKRRMYRPTRKMRKSMRRNEETQGFDEPLLLEAPTVVDVEEPAVDVEGSTLVGVPEADEDEPTVDVHIPDVSPSSGEAASGPSMQASDREPASWKASTAPVAQLVAPERVLVIAAEKEPEPIVPPQPEPIVPPQPEPIVPPLPEPEVPSARAISAPPTAPSTLGPLQQRLFELRQQLEGFKVEGLQLDPPSNGATDGHRDLGTGRD